MHIVSSNDDGRSETAEDLHHRFLQLVHQKKITAARTQIQHEFASPLQKSQLMFLTAPSFIRQVAQRIPTESLIEKGPLPIYISFRQK